MKKSKKLWPYQGVTIDREAEAVKAFKVSQEILNESKNRLGGLEAYKLDYHLKYEAEAKGGMTVDKITNYREFTRRLDEAVKLQQEIVRSHETDLDEKRNAWILARSKVKTVEKLVHKLSTEDQLKDEKQQQHALDDLANNNRSRELVK